MPPPTVDTSNWWKLTMKFRSYQQSWSEHYWMKQTSFATNKANANCLARWRAAILARDVILDYAVVVQLGPARTSRVAINNPIRGSTGVKFDASTYSEIAFNVNTPGDGLQIRMEMVNDRHADRHIKGLPDAMVNRKKFIPPGGVEDTVDFGNYSAAMSADEVPQMEEVFDFAKAPPYTAAQLSKFVNWDTALERFFKAVYNFTTGQYDVIGENGVPTGAKGFANWDNFVYRYASSRTVGDPF